MRNDSNLIHDAVPTWLSCRQTNRFLYDQLYYDVIEANSRAPFRMEVEKALYGGNAAIVPPRSILVHDIRGRVVQLWPFKAHERSSAQDVRELNFLKARHSPIAISAKTLKVRLSWSAAVSRNLD